MIAVREIVDLGEYLKMQTRRSPHAVYDTRIDSDVLNYTTDPVLLRHVQHQALLRCYQSRYVLLPVTQSRPFRMADMHRYYDGDRLERLHAIRPSLEKLLIRPLISCDRRVQSCPEFIEKIRAEIAAEQENRFVAFLARSPNREHHYRNFLIQSSVDLLAEASASALGTIGEFGPVQSALFRILIDEFGYGKYDRKHSSLYRTVMRSFGLCDEYSAYWPWFQTSSLKLHNVIHYLFQNPGNFFLQIGFLLYAETSYQRSTQAHHDYLVAFHPEVDARYFAEHAHIDLYHTRVVVEDVIAPLMSKYGEEVGQDIVKGAELTRAVFSDAAEQLLAVSQKFDELAQSTDGATFSVPADIANTSELGHCVTPDTAAGLQYTNTLIQVSGIGTLCNAEFATFPSGTIGRTVLE